MTPSPSKAPYDSVLDTPAVEDTSLPSDDVLAEQDESPTSGDELFSSIETPEAPKPVVPAAPAADTTAAGNGDELFSSVEGPKPSLGAIAGGVGTTAAKMGLFVGAQHTAKAVGGRVLGPVAGQAVMAAGHVPEMISDYVAGRHLEQIAAQLPGAGVPELRARAETLMGDWTPDRQAAAITRFRNQFADQIPASISDEELAPIVRRYLIDSYIHNRVNNYVETQKSLMGDVAQTGSEGQHEAVSAIADALFLNVPGIDKLGKTVAGAFATSPVGRGAIGHIASQMVQHGITGGLFGAGFGGAEAGVNAGVDAYQAGAGAADIVGATVKGAYTGAKENLGFGALIGAGLGLVGGAWGVKGAGEAAKDAKRIAAATDAQRIAVKQFAENFSPRHLAEKFQQDFSDAQATGMSDAELAASIVSKLYPGVSADEAGMKAAATIAGKIAPWRAANAEFAPRLPVSPEAQQMAAQKAAAAQAAAQMGIQQGAAGLAPSPIENVPGTLKPATMMTPGVQSPPAGLNQPIDIEQTPSNPRTLGPEPLVRQEAPQPINLPRAPIPGLNMERGQMEPGPQPFTPPAEAPPLEPSLVSPQTTGPVPGEPPRVPPQYPEAVQGPYPASENRTFTPPAAPPPIAEGFKGGEFEKPAPKSMSEHDAQVLKNLNSIAAGASERLKKKMGRLNSGFDVSMVGDAAIKLAADMFSRRLRARSEIAAHLVDEYGNKVKPFVDRLIESAQKHFVRMFKDTGVADEKLKELMGLYQSGLHGANWYENTADWAKKKFGDKADTFLRFLAVTSANGQTEAGAALAMKAMAQHDAGMDFEGMRGPSMVDQLKLVAKGGDLPADTKIKNFYDALRGDENAVVLDRWMMDALNMKDSGGSLPPKKYRIYEHAVKQLAKENNMSPRQFQAAVWEGARIRNAHVKEAKGGRAAATKIGSARPLEDLVERKLNGMSFDEYADKVAGDLKRADALYKGLKPVREAVAPKTYELLDEDPAKTGHTFDANTLEPAKHKGFVVSLLSHNTERNRLYPSRVMKFKSQVQPLIDELEKSGHKPTIGVFRLGNEHGDPTGEFSIDLNVMVDNEEKALELGRLNRQFAIAELGHGGEWKRNIDTGYDEATHGKQFKPPHDYTKQPQWYKQQITRARAFLKKVGL